MLKNKFCKDQCTCSEFYKRYIKVLQKATNVTAAVTEGYDGFSFPTRLLHF